ncbi:MAG: hypothetical protein QOD77_230 [Thermoplasmata archaeon]|nr:hypothetical protein [Thermoplasmata archaeon]
MVLPLAAAQDVRVQTFSPVPPGFVAGLVGLASTMQEQAEDGPCSDLPAGGHACEYTLAYAQATLDAALCVQAGNPIPECMEALSGIFCLTFRILASPILLDAPIDPFRLYMDASVMGYGPEMTISPGAVDIHTNQLGLGSYRFTTSPVSECNSA